MTKFEKIFKLANKKGKYTATEREFIVELCAEYDVPVNTLCPECYRDAAVALYGILKPKEKSNAKYQLRDGVDVWWNGLRINEATIDDKKAAQYIKKGLPRILFKVLPE